LSEQITRTPTRIRNSTNDVSTRLVVGRRQIGPHRIKTESLGLNFLAVNRRCSDYRIITTRLQFQRKGHEWMQVAEGSPSGKDHSFRCSWRRHRCVLCGSCVPARINWATKKHKKEAQKVISISTTLQTRVFGRSLSASMAVVCSVTLSSEPANHWCGPASVSSGIFVSPVMLRL